MSAVYNAFLKPAFQLPPKYGLFLAGWLYLCSHKNEPLPGTREMNLEEWVVTPTEYTAHPSNHPKLFGRAPGESALEDNSAKLYQAPKGGHGHH